MNEGNHIISSNVLEKIALIMPAIEKKKDINSAMEKHIKYEWMLVGSKHRDVMNIIKPFVRPLKSPPKVYPSIIIHAGNGETKSSSIFFWNFILKKDEDVLLYELIIIAIATSPGIR